MHKSACAQHTIFGNVSIASQTMEKLQNNYCYRIIIITILVEPIYKLHNQCLQSIKYKIIKGLQRLQGIQGLWCIIRSLCDR